MFFRNTLFHCLNCDEVKLQLLNNQTCISFVNKVIVILNPNVNAFLEMTKIRLTKVFNFEMAHALWNYDGPCRNIHGHSYVLAVTLIGEPIQDANNPKYGMVVDFGEIKKWVKNRIVDEFDHSLLISNQADTSEINASMQMFSRLRMVNFQPTCENLLIYIAEIIKEQLPENIHLHSLKLQETASSWAEWYADDNA